MKLLDIELSPEIKNIINSRRKKILFAMYILCIAILIIVIIKDIHYNNIEDYVIETFSLILISFSFFYIYKKKKYDLASYSIILITSLAVIASIVVNKFDDYTPVFLIPISISIFFLFSWKKGILVNTLLYFVVFSIYIIGRNYFSDSFFIHNNSAVLNLFITISIILVFTYFYEIARVDAYKMLLLSNHKKDLLYSEVHHRVKNNLNIVLSMLSIQAKEEDKKVQDIIETSKKRIESIAMVHSMLYISNDLEKVNAKQFIKKLILNLQNTINSNIKITQQIDDLELPLNDIIPIGLILNELLTNSFKYAFSTTSNPKIIIILKMHNNAVLLTYADNGSGYKTNHKQNVGLKLVTLNVKQLKGKIEIKEKDGLIYNIKYERVLNV